MIEYELLTPSLVSEHKEQLYHYFVLEDVSIFAWSSLPMRKWSIIFLLLILKKLILEFI